MRLALLSDIHGNLQALQACLAHAQAQGVDRIAVLGDLVGYGAHPAEVVERVMALADQGALVLQGNHDAMAVSPPLEVRTIGDSTAGWTHQQLRPAQLQWLAQLPLTAQLGSALLVHASADQPGRWTYVYDERSAGASLDASQGFADVHHVFCGHVHEQNLFFRKGQGRVQKFVPLAGVEVPVPAHRLWLATIGSVGQPRDGRPDAMYALFDSAAAQLCFLRVAYDYCAAAQAIRDAGLPEYFAERLERGR